MGQKVNATGYRLSVTRNWESEWYDKKRYNCYLQEDFLIRRYLTKKFQKRLYLGSCIIQRAATNKLKINMMVYPSVFSTKFHNKMRYKGFRSRKRKYLLRKQNKAGQKYKLPSVRLDKKPVKVNNKKRIKIKKRIRVKKKKKLKQKIIKKKPKGPFVKRYRRRRRWRRRRLRLPRHFYRFSQKAKAEYLVWRRQTVREELTYYKNIILFLRKLTNMDVSLNLQKPFIRYQWGRKPTKLPRFWRRFRYLYKFFIIMQHKPNSQMIAHALKKEFEKLKRHTGLFQFLKRKVLNLYSFHQHPESPLLGIKIQFKGRINNSRRGRKQVLRMGRVPLNTLEIPVQYTAVPAIHKAGITGIKVWVAFKKHVC